MKTTGNTILITGGGSGIGRGLAEAFHKLGNQVVISGRKQKNLDAVVAANPGMKALTADMNDAEGVQEFARRLTSEFPALNVAILNAGIMKTEDVLDASSHVADAEEIIATNLLGPIRLTAALLPHLQKQADAVVMTVSSGLAFVPIALTPTYCATKAAIHSYSQTLRYQLKDTSVDVVELIPPYVQTTLMGEHQANDSRAMPLDEYIQEVMGIIQNQPDAEEICVQRVYPQRFAAQQGQEKYDELFRQRNEAMPVQRK